MADVDPTLRRAWREHPRAKIDLILHIDGNLRSSVDQLQERGIKVTRRFRLTKRVAIHCTGAAATKLAQEPWITTIESDKRVEAL